MTVQELIDQLQLVDDKSMKVFISDEEYGNFQATESFLSHDDDLNPVIKIY